VYGDRIRPLFEQQRQILVPYLTQREAHSGGVSPIAEHRREVELSQCPATQVRELRTSHPFRRLRPLLDLRSSSLPAHGEPTDRAALERVLS